MKVLIEPFSSADFWRLSGAVKLRIYANQSFWSSDGQYVPRGTVGAANTAYLEVDCTVLGSVLSIPEIEIDSTVDGLDNPFTTYTAELVAGGRRVTFVTTFPVNTLEAGDPSTTWAEILILRNLLVPQTITENLTRQINALITVAVGNLNKGSESNTGGVAITENATDPAFPIAVSATDPIYLALQSEVLGDDITGIFPDLAVNAVPEATPNVIVRRDASGAAVVYDLGAQVFNVRAFGAVGDGVADDTAAFQDAFTAAQAVNGTVVVPSTITGYKITATLTITAPMAIRGEGGATANWSDFTGACAGPGCFDPTQAKGPRLVWAGGAASMLTITNIFGVIIDNLVLDGVDTATTILQLDRVRHSQFRQVSCMRAATLAMHIGSTSTAGGSLTADGCYENAFYSCFFHGPKGVLLDKIGAGITGGYHNRMYSCIIHYTGDTTANIGLHIVSGDNNSFYGLRSQNVDGTSDRGVQLESSVTVPGGSIQDPLKAANNYFWHLQAHRVYVADDALYAGVVFGLDTENFPDLPVIGTNARLAFTIDGQSAPTGIPLWRLEGALIQKMGYSTDLDVVSSAEVWNPALRQSVALTGTFNYTIPLTTEYPGYVGYFTNFGAGTITLQRTGADVFHGRGAASATSFALTAGTSVRLHSDGGGAWLLF